MDDRKEIYQDLCINCYNCKQKKDKVYCKFGVFEEKAGTPILHTPQDYDCPEFDEM